MKYQELYDLSRKGNVVVEFHTNIIPQKGWAVPTNFPITDFYPEYTFDDMIDSMVKYAYGQDRTHLLVIDGLLGYGVVFNNQQYAMGYAHAVGDDFIIDCFTGKKIIRR